MNTNNTIRPPIGIKQIKKESKAVHTAPQELSGSSSRSKISLRSPNVIFNTIFTSVK